MKNKTRMLSAAILITVCIATMAQRGNVREAKPNEVPFAYNPSDYGKVEIESVPKSVFQPGDMPTEAPAHSCYHLEVCIIPLTDTSVKDYAKAYPYIHEAAVKLRKLLAKRPAKFSANKDINDVPFNNASAAIQSKVQYLPFKTGTGILFLTQYSQDIAPSPVNNEELTCNFQGLTADGNFYVAARLAITHPSLPKGIDFTNVPERERDKKQTYLKKDERLLNSFTDESFRPSLTSLKAMIASITTNGN
jgi:hypothetical protein